MKKRQPCIYKITNIVDGKVYIGQTVVDYERRIGVHFSKLKKGSHNNLHLQRAFIKYGEENFLPALVTTCSIEEIDDIEKYWIKYYKEKNLSYNIEDGGNYIKKISKETKEKLRSRSAESWKDEEIKNKRIRNMARRENNFNSVPVICVTDGKKFVSMTEASEYYGVSFSAISSSIYKQHYCRSDKGRLEFYRYVEGEVYRPKKSVHGQAIKVVCLTTGEVFNSVKDAADAYNLETTNISKVCKGKRKSTGKLLDGSKLKWAYHEEHLSN